MTGQRPSSLSGVLLYMSYESRVSEKSLNRKERRRRAGAHEAATSSAFLKARNNYLKAHHLKAIPLAGRLEKRLEARALEYRRALEAYLSAYAARCGERKARTKKFLLESDTVAMSRKTTATQFWLGKAVKGAVIDAPVVLIKSSETGKKLLEFANRNAATRILAAGAVVAVATVAVAGSVQTAAAATAAFTVVRVGSLFAAKRAIPQALVRIPYFRNVERMARVRAGLGWISWIGGGAIAWEALHSNVSDEVMGALHMQSPHEHLDQTAHNIMADLIEQKRGIPTFVPSENGKPIIEEALSPVSLSTDARAHSPLLEGMYERLISFEGRRALLLNDESSRALLTEGLEKMRHLRILEEANLHGNAATPGYADIPNDLSIMRASARDWLHRFDAAARTGTAEHHKNAFELAAEYAVAKPARELPSLSDLVAHPARLSDLPLTGDITPEHYEATLAALRERVGTAEDVAHFYVRVIGPEALTTSDHTYGNLITALHHYQGLQSELEALGQNFSGMPADHRVIEHAGSLSGGDLTDAILHEKLRSFDFSHYEEAWKAVEAAERRAESIPYGSTMVNGKIMPLNEVVAFKAGVHSAGLPPSMTHTLYNAFQKLRSDGTRPVITEGFNLTYHGHISECHSNGTCVDFAVPWTGKNIYNTFNDLGPAGHLLLEAKSGGETVRLEEMMRDYLVNTLHQTPDAADEWMRLHADVRTIPWATANNFHFEPKNGTMISDPLTS